MAVTTDASRRGPTTEDGSLLPIEAVLPDVLPSDSLNQRGRPTGALRQDLRRIQNLRNGFTVAFALVQTFGLIIVAAVLNTWWSYLLAFVFMARGHVCLNILAHEAAHRLLFTNQKLNDFVGRWFLGYPTFQAMLGYRRAHVRHHRVELGPEEPDLALYTGYPVPADSWRRKLKRDLLGISAYKNFKGLYYAAKKGRLEARQIIALHVVGFGFSLAVMRPFAYLAWIASFSTLWRFSNRLRSISEHGGLEQSKDRRRTTHVVRQSPLIRYWMTPYNTGWHLAHHVDMGVPWRNLPRLHQELVESGWVTEELEYPNYRAFWAACSSGSGASPSTMSTGNSFIGE